MGFHDDLKLKMHQYAKKVYRVTKNFPRDELFGMVSQLRRSALSVILNYIEGYARRRGDKCKVYKNFLEISYGSLKEAKYLVYFSHTEGYLDELNNKELTDLADEIGGMLWGILNKIS